MGQRLSCFKIAVLLCLLMAAFAYSRYVDWPSFGDTDELRIYLPDEYQLDDPRYYQLRNFMDTWELFKFNTSPSAMEFLIDELNLESQGFVYNFPLIISRPPPYWWHPERLDEAELFQSSERAADGRHYELLYAEASGIVFMIRFDS